MEILQLLVSGISLGCVYGLVALGFVLIYKATEMVNFAQGEMMMLGAFIGFTYINVLGLSFFWGVIATIATMAFIGVVVERIVLRPMIGEPPFATLMITIGLGFILRAIAGAVWGNDPKSINSPYSGAVFRYGEVAIGYENLAVVAGTLVLCIALFLFFRYTRLGIAMQAASQNQLAAFYVGIPVKRTFAIVWALSACIAATAGILVAPITLIDPMMGFVSVKAFAAAIVGGFGSLPGALIGGLIIGISEQFAGLYGPPGSADMTAYVILLAMLFIRPQGIFATMQQKKV